MRRLQFAAGLLAVTAFLACPGTAIIKIPGGDAGFSGDSGLVVDAGPRIDAGADAGSIEDAGGSDAGGSDAGGSDAGNRQDAGTSLDAGVVRPIGVNMPDLLFQYLGQAPGTPASARLEMDRARAAGFTHVRFIASGYWPTNMSTGNGWLAAPAAYWASFDQMVFDARARGLRLVPSVFWNAFLFPDLNNAPLSALLTPGTPTRQMAEQYLAELVTRYRAEPAIFAWEIGNELNLLADLDFSACTVCAGAASGCGTLAPSLGTPCRRTAADQLFSCNSCRGVLSAAQDLGQFTGAMATLIQSIDPARPVSSGNAYPRPAAWHLARSPCPGCDWTLDTVPQYEATLAQLHPGNVQLVSVHHYPGDDAMRFGSIDPAGVSLLQTTQGLVSAMGKTLYVGEYGEPRAGTAVCGATEQCGGDPGAAATRRVLDTLVSEQVPLSALWAFEFHQFCAAVPTCYSIEAGDGLTFALIASQNSAGSCTARPDGSPCPIGACTGGTCAPISLQRFDFSSSGDENAWLTFTNCSSCAPGTRVRANAALQLTSFTLQCSGTCMYPGVYALSPPILAGTGNLIVAADLQSSASTATLRLIAYDAAGVELDSVARTAPPGGVNRTVSIHFKLPSATAQIRARLELPAPGATFTADNFSFTWRP